MQLVALAGAGEQAPWQGTDLPSYLCAVSVQQWSGVMHMVRDWADHPCCRCLLCCCSCRWLLAHTNVFVGWLFNVSFSLGLVYASTWLVVNIAPEAAGGGVAGAPASRAPAQGACLWHSKQPGAQHARMCQQPWAGMASICIGLTAHCLLCRVLPPCLLPPFRPGANPVQR